MYYNWRNLYIKLKMIVQKTIIFCIQCIISTFRARLVGKYRYNEICIA